MGSPQPEIVVDSVDSSFADSQLLSKHMSQVSFGPGAVVAEPAPAAIAVRTPPSKLNGAASSSSKSSLDLLLASDAAPSSFMTFKAGPSFQKFMARPDT